MHILNKKILKIINEKEVVLTSERNNASVLPEDEWSPWWLSLRYTLPGQHPRKHQTRKHIKMDNKIIKRRCPNRRSKPLTWGCIMTLTHQVSWFWENNNDTTGLIQKWWCYDYWLHCMLTLSLSKQNPNTFPVKGIKGTSIKGESLVLLVQKKDYLYILGPVVWEKKDDTQMFSHMNGRYFCWTNIVSANTVIIFGIINHFLEGSHSGTIFI